MRRSRERQLEEAIALAPWRVGVEAVAALAGRIAELAADSAPEGLLPAVVASLAAMPDDERADLLHDLQLAAALDPGGPFARLHCQLATLEGMPA